MHTDDASPKIIATARDENIGSRPIQSGSIPPIVVIAVKNIGVMRLLADFCITRRRFELFLFFLSFSIVSSSTTALFVAIPTRHTYAKKSHEAKIAFCY